MKNEYGCGQQDDSLSESDERFFELVDKIDADDLQGFKELILDKKYDVNMIDFDSTANLLTYSIEKKRKEIVSFLLNHPDTDVHFESCDGKNALVFAADAGDFETTEILLSRGINIRIRTGSQNHNILRYAIRGGNMDVLKILLPLMTSEEMNNRNKIGRTPVTLPPPKGRGLLKTGAGPGATPVRRVASGVDSPSDNFGPCPGYYCSPPNPRVCASPKRVADTLSGRPRGTEPSPRT